MNIDKTDKVHSGDRVLFVNCRGFGDVLQTAASVKIFKDKFPGTSVTFLTCPQYTELLSYQPYIDGVIGGERLGLRSFLSTVDKVRDIGQFDWIMNFQGKSKIDTLGLLCGIPHKIGTGRRIFYDAELWDWFDSNQCDIRKRESVSIFSPEPALLFARKILSNLPEKKIFCIIGAGWKEKMWPVNYWCEFLQKLLAEGWGVVLNGYGKFEEEFAGKVESEIDNPNVLNLVSKLDFCNMAGVASQCSIAVGNDTGPLHLAALEGVPTLGIFGGTSSEMMGLLMPWFRSIYTTCYKAGCDSTMKCIRNIKYGCLTSVTPDRVRVVFDQLAMLSNMNLARH